MYCLIIGIVVPSLGNFLSIKIPFSCSFCSANCFSSSLCKDKSLEINGFTITLVWQSGYHEVFNTWINKGHKGYGDSIINLNWGIESFLNIDNQGNDIILKDKYKISQYKSPRLKYWK